MSHFERHKKRMQFIVFQSVNSHLFVSALARYLITLILISQGRVSPNMRLYMMNFPTSDVLCPESCNHLVLMPAANKLQETVNKATRRIHHPPLSLSSCLPGNSADTLDIVCSSPQQSAES